MIPRCIDTTHSIAISALADRVEREARLGIRINDTLHLTWARDGCSMTCVHVGPTVRAVFSAGRRAGKTAMVAELFRHPTPFGFCNSADVAAELNLRQILARDRLTAAIEKGYVLNYLKVWE